MLTVIHDEQLATENFYPMLNPDKMLRAVIELIFVLLGALIVWLGLTGHIFFDRRRIGWLLLSVALILLGVRTLYQSGGKARTYKPNVEKNNHWSRAEDWTRGLSLLLLGLVMLAIARVPFSWVGPLLAAGGVLLAMRGLAGTVLVFRPR